MSREADRNNADRDAVVELVRNQLHGSRVRHVFGTTCCFSVTYPPDTTRPSFLVCVGRRAWGTLVPEGDGLRNYWVSQNFIGRGWRERLADDLVLNITGPPVHGDQPADALAMEIVP